MMIGIIGAWIFIKKWVYLCPVSAAYPGSFNPDNSFLQDIWTVMQYWLHIGMLICSWSWSGEASCISSMVRNAEAREHYRYTGSQYRNGQWQCT